MLVHLVNYSKSLVSGSYTITPIIENPSYFSISPSTLTVDFPLAASPFSQDFCVTPNGVHADIEIVLLPLTAALPGANASYKIVYKNKGTITQSGTVNLNFNDAVMDVVTSSPSVTTQSNSNLNWAFTNLAPLETRFIVVTFNINSATETPAVTSGQQLNYAASVTTSTTDETPIDSTSQLLQTVVSTDENYTKTCTEGNTITPSQVGNYMHYIIRFRNTGTITAQHIVVKDIIDTSKFDVSTLLPIDGSHLFETRLSEQNKIEFVFQNINLSNNSPNNDGYVAFKIKTLPSLVTGDTFTNSATIYFDYKAPLTSNVASTTVQALTNEGFELSQVVTVYPNPVKNVLTINNPTETEINTLGIYTTLGQLIQAVVSPQTNTIDVSHLTAGVYILNLTTEKGVASIKFIKE